MKKLLIYEEEGEYVIERVNEFNHSFKRFYDGKAALMEGLEEHRPLIRQADVYELDVQEGLFEKFFMNNDTK